MPNVILIVNDSLRADHVGCYDLPAPWDRAGHEGEAFIETPNLDRLGATGTIFDRCYISSYPTVPLRHDIVTGNIGFPTQGWQPLTGSEETLSEKLEAAGIATHFIFDTTPLGDDSFNFMKGFGGWEWVRGQHMDRYVNEPMKIDLPAARRKLKSPRALTPYLMNSKYRRRDRDWMATKTALTAAEWLERNTSREEGFFLWVDMWDPHEPFDAPDYDIARYSDPNYAGDQVIYPRYGRADYLSAGEMNDIRARYAANVQMADRAVGKILDAVDFLGLRDDTMIIHTTDHGHLFGDHGLQGKPTGPLGRLYEPTVRVPLLIRHPERIGSGERVEGIVQQPDIFATVLDFLNVEGTCRDGKSLLPLMRNSAERLRTEAFSGRYSAAVVSVSKDKSDGAADAAKFDGWVGLEAASEPVTVSTEQWSLIVPPVGGPPLELYDLVADPRQLSNVASSHPDVVQDLLGRLKLFLQEHGSEEQRVAIYDWPSIDSSAVMEMVLPEDLPLYGFECEGTTFAFMSEQEASVTSSGEAIMSTTLGALLSKNEEALVSIGDQYYRTADLALIRRVKSPK